MITIKEMQKSGQFFRMFKLKPGAITKGHKHLYDHNTFLFSGEVELEKNGEFSTVKAPAVIFISKDIKHNFKALTDNVIYACVFSWRDEMGQVVEDKSPNNEHSGDCVDSDEHAASIFKKLTEKTCGSCSGCD